MTKRNKIIGAIVVVIVIITILALWKLSGNDTVENNPETLNGEPTKDSLEATMDFYMPWFEAMQSTSTDPYTLSLLNSPLLDDELRTRLAERSGETPDPVLCQLELPERIGAKVIYTTDTESQVMVVARGSKTPESALVTMTIANGEWLISDISCSQGETAPDREFSFEQEGRILKQSLLPPLDTQYWHLVFNQGGQSGHTVPLFFTEASTCISLDAGESICVPEQLTEATKVLVKGEMTESGVELKRLEILQ